MASSEDDKLGTAREFELRDDDRPSASAYSGGRGRGRSGYGAVLLLGILATAALIGYGALHRGEVKSPDSGGQATAGSTR